MRNAFLATWAFLAITAVACGHPDSGSGDEPRAGGTSERQRLLATCPGKAQDYDAWQQALAENRGLNRPIWEDDVVLDPTARVAQNYLETLPVNQRGGVGIDSVRNQVIVQVTGDADRVLTALRTKVSRPDAVAVETVRWSSKELAAFANRIEKIKGANINGIGSGNANGRVEVYVTRDVENAHQRIAEVVDPCAFKVIRSAPMSPS
jgi:hypothetical protein